MQTLKDIKGLRLKNFVPFSTYKNQEYDYGTIKGRADVIGWHIIFFNENTSNNDTSVISLDEVIYNEELKKIANNILKEIEFPLNFDNTSSDVIKIFGTPYYTDELYEDQKRYLYFMEDICTLICFNIDDKDGINSIEIVNNNKIIKERLNQLEG